MPVPVVLVAAASKPTAVLFDAVLLSNVDIPIAVLLLPVVLNNNANVPLAVLLLPVVLFYKD